MLGGMLIDERGRSWPDSASNLARHIGYRGSPLELPAYAIRRGLIHIDPKGDKMRVSLCAGRFSTPALAGALRKVHEEAPRRILLAVLSNEEWSYGICSSVAELAARAEEIANEKPFRRRPWLAIEQSSQIMTTSPNFHRVTPIIRLWQETRGRTPENLPDMLCDSGLFARSVVARPRGNCSRLVIDHFGTGFNRAMNPCDGLLQVGRDLDDVLDRDYASWVAESYARALAERRLRFEACDATFRTSEATSIRARYDRVLIPWAGKSKDLLIVGISIRRSVTSVS